MSSHTQAGHRALGAMTAVLIVLAIVAVALAVSVARPEGAGAKVAKGLVDASLERAYCDVSSIPSVAQDMGAGGLGATWTRINVHWAALQPDEPADPAAPVYDAQYLARLDAVIAGLHAQGLQVILTPIDVPRWASDQRLWSDPPSDNEPGYQPFYALDTRSSSKALPSFRALGAFLASRYGAPEYGVTHMEVWNEPNLGLWLYPQRVSHAADRGPNVYMLMLSQFATGVRSAGKGVRIIGGATAPRGTDNDYSTTPQRFAKYLRSHGALKYMDAYSHHPYTPRGTKRANRAPNRPPDNQRRCVTLYNLRALLDVFPKLDFYLTEYGYGTHESKLFGYQVSEAEQARYLKQAFAYVARYRHVKALLWYLRQDSGDFRTNRLNGSYTGLREADGTRKPSWFAFQGGTALSIEAPTSVATATPFTVAGAVTSPVAGVVPGAAVRLETRTLPSGAWKVRGQTTSDPSGAYSFTLKLSSNASCRVVWDGVRNSSTRAVRVH